MFYSDTKMRHTSNWEKFWLLMWKNGLLQWRHKIRTIIEILVPVLLTVVLVWLRSLIVPYKISHATFYEPVAIDSLEPLRKFVNGQQANDASIKVWKLAYSPKNALFDSLLEHASTALKLDGFVGVDNATALESLVTSKMLVAGVEFNHPSDITELPKNLLFALRFPSEQRMSFSAQFKFYFNWGTNLLFPLSSSYVPPDLSGGEGGMYNKEGFLAIQDALSRAFTEIKSNTDIPNILLRRFPYPPHTYDPIMKVFEVILTLIILLSFIYPCINTVRFIAIEKEKQLKEAMKIMGLPNWLHWSGWFLRSMIFMTLSITIIVALWKIEMFGPTTIVPNSDFTVLWVFLFIFSISMTTFCFMLSVFFAKANTAAAVAGLIWFLLYVPFSITQQNYEHLALSTKLLICLSSNSAMAYGIQLILRFESSGEGLRWSNLMRPVTIDDNLSVAVVMGLMLLTSCIYMLITLYVERVMPGSYGVPEPWYFPFTKEFWFGVPEYYGTNDDLINDSNHLHNRLNFEADPRNRRAGIQVKNLRKVYANKKVAVQGLTINMFDDQITVLLGHNGAGKTTTMSMLIGMFPPTSGTAWINGYDIRKNLSKARSSIGLCPQHNILFDDLTVREHIVFYSRLKGLDAQAVEEEVNKYVKLLDLEPKMNALSSTLSGGMKRKLSVGVALCGRSKVVLCDEPSSGMDPAARRALWDLLQTEKQGRTILLSTHFMDEADILGDRIAIMADGELKCSGTSFFLKKRFGTGYHLICVKNDDCDSNEVTKLLRRHVPDIDIESEVGSELFYQLPDEQVNAFERMFRDLEQNQESLKLRSFGVSLTTLEEVFLKVGTDSSQLDGKTNGIDAENGEFNGNYDSENNTASIASETVPLLRGLALRRNQWFAMLKKRYLNWIRTWIMIVLQNIIPIAFVIISVLVVRSLGTQTELPPLEITLNSYDKSVTLLQTHPNDKPNSQTAKIITGYKEIFKQQPPETRLNAITEDMQTYFLKLAKTHSVLMNSQYLVGATIDNKNLIAWFNNHPFHTTPLTINLMHNALVKAALDAEHSIRVINKPLPFTVHLRMTMLSVGNNMGYQLATNIAFAMAFVSGFYILFYIKERENKAKLLQLVSGANVATYWITSFLWDYATFLLTATLLIITLAGFQEEDWATVYELLRVAFILLLFGFAMLPMTFIASMFFTVPSSGFVRWTVINIFSGIAVFLMIFGIMMSGADFEYAANIAKSIFLVLPQYALSNSLNNLNEHLTMDRICKAKCALIPLCTEELLCKFDKECCASSFYSWKEPGIGRNLTYMVVTGIVSFTILLIIEYKLFAGVIYNMLSIFKRKLPAESEDATIDDDVAEEKRRVDQMTSDDLQLNNLVVNRVSKFYGRFLAVNQISVGIKPAECFGLLGINGAGKTSTFKMLTGDERISRGEAWIRGISLKTDMNKVHKIMGYCPQFDALIENLTGRETLEMFALLRGVPFGEVNGLSLRLANDLHFLEHIDKKISEYSGGNKRKLSTAVALIGNPDVIFLDEPSTGMDPGAKRNLWNLLGKVRSAGKSIVLTSHSMEECEALCTRLAIMVNGEFKCLGSTQHLKNKFSKGFVLTIKVQKSSETDIFSSENNQLLNEMNAKITYIKDFVTKNFSGAFLKEEYQGLLTYYVPISSNLKWSTVFGLMEMGKQTLQFEDYSISQTSLEQVFLSFTKDQHITKEG